MRGGPRLMCSPYLTGSLGIMLCILAFNYWSIATENSDLTSKIQEMQQQLKSGTIHIKDIEEELRIVRDNEKNCKIEKDSIKHDSEAKFDKLKQDSNAKYDKLEEKHLELEKQMKFKEQDDEAEELKLTEDKEMKEKENDHLRDVIEGLKKNLTEVQEAVSQCQGQLASERADQMFVPPAGAGVPPRHLPAGPLGPGQLPDINPDSVSVVRKETQGMRFHQDKSGHWLPIIVQGDPSKPRAKPSVSVMDIKQRVKKDALLGAGLTIEEEEAHDVKNDIVQVHGSSSRSPVSVSSSSPSRNNNDALALGPGVVPAPAIVVNEAGVMPLPNLDKAEDDINVNHNEEDDDQNPDGMIDETVDLDKQSYLVDKNQDDGDNLDSRGVDDKPSDKVDNEADDALSDESVGKDKLENLKETLSKDEAEDNQIN